MLLHELLPLFQGVRLIVDVTPERAGITRHLRVPDGLPVDTRDPGETDRLDLDLGPGSLLVGLVGPDVDAHTDPDALAPLLRRLGPGAQALLLVGWPIEELPRHRLLGPLVSGACQVLDAVPLDRVSGHGVHCALVVRRVDAVAPPRAYLMDIRPETPAAARQDGGYRADAGPDGANPAAPEGWGPDGELRGILRLVNEYVLTDLASRPTRRRLVELEGKANDLGERLAERERELAERQLELAAATEALTRVRADLRRYESELAEKTTALAEKAALLADRDTKLTTAQARVAKLTAKVNLLETSVSYQLGRMLVGGLRHPGRGLVSAPGNVAQVWRTVRARRRPVVTAKPAAPTTRVVPIALPPAVPAGNSPALLTMTAPSRLLVPRKLAENGLAAYEPGALACFLAALDIAGPGAVLDIGANVGVYAALASALTDREVVAFEPTPELVTMARDFATDNKLGYRVEALALGAENGTAQLHLSTSSDTSNSLAAGYRTAWAHIEVPVETLDSYLARTDLVPAVMKVDTETTEPEVLRGAAESIAKHRPWILCEVLSGRAEDKLAEAIAPHGYHWYHVTEENPYRKTDRVAGDPTYKYLMYLFAPEEPTDEFWTALRKRTEGLAGCTAGRAAELATGNGRAPAGTLAG